MAPRRTSGGLLALLAAVLLSAHCCSGVIQCAMYVMDKPGNGLGKLYTGKEMTKPAIDCDSPDIDLMNRVCTGWFAKVNTKWSLTADSRSRGSPHTIGDDLCRLLKVGTYTFGAFYTYCGNDKPMYSGSAREDSTLCCKDGVVC